MSPQSCKCSNLNSDVRLEWHSVEYVFTAVVLDPRALADARPTGDMQRYVFNVHSAELVKGVWRDLVTKYITNGNRLYILTVIE